MITNAKAAIRTSYQPLGLIACHQREVVHVETAVFAKTHPSLPIIESQSASHGDGTVRLFRKFLAGMLGLLIKVASLQESLGRELQARLPNLDNQLQAEVPDCETSSDNKRSRCDQRASFGVVVVINN